MRNSSRSLSSSLPFLSYVETLVLRQTKLIRLALLFIHTHHTSIKIIPPLLFILMRCVRFIFNAPSPPPHFFGLLFFSFSYFNLHVYFHVFYFYLFNSLFFSPVSQRTQTPGAHCRFTEQGRQQPIKCRERSKRTTDVTLCI